jgi:hypothetical protein
MPDRDLRRTENLAEQLARNKVPDAHLSADIPGAHVLALQENVGNLVWSVFQERPHGEARVRVIDTGIALMITGKEVFFILAETKKKDAQVARLMVRELVHQRAPSLNVPKTNGGINASRVEPLSVRG